MPPGNRQAASGTWRPPRAMTSFTASRLILEKLLTGSKPRAAGLRSESCRVLLAGRHHPGQARIRRQWFGDPRESENDPAGADRSFSDRPVYRKRSAEIINALGFVYDKRLTTPMRAAASRKSSLFASLCSPRSATESSLSGSSTFWRSPSTTWRSYTRRTNSLTRHSNCLRNR